MTNHDSRDALDELIETIRRQFINGPPNGWELGWDDTRFCQEISDICSPLPVVNNTTFDYAFCNWYDIDCGAKWGCDRVELTVKVSVIAPVCSMHWTCRTGTCFSVASKMPEGKENKQSAIAAMLRRQGIYELEVGVDELIVPDVALELSETRNVTVGKCLFSDFDG
jgi:hypothetical protein